MRKNYLEGAIDLHFHAGPDVRERKLTYFEAAMQAEKAGMRAILIKSHSTITADIASLIQQLIQIGFSDQEIDQMVRINPSRLLNLT